MSDNSVNLNAMMEGFNSVRPGGLGLYLEPGYYGLIINEAKNGHAPNGGFDFFVAEFTIVSSTNPMLPPGSRVEWMVAFKNPTYKQTYQGNVKRFLFAAIASGDPSWTMDRTTVDAWLFAVSEQQPLRGMPILAEAFNAPKKNNKEEMITKVHFKPWPGGPVGEAGARQLQAQQVPAAQETLTGHAAS